MSTESPVHGREGAYNGHFESTWLLLFNQHGDCLAAKLRAGNVSSAEDWDELLLPEIERQQAEGKHVMFRADAAFAKPEIYEALEQRGVDYVIRCRPTRTWSWRSTVQAERQAAGALQELPLPSRELVQAPTDRRQGRASSRRVVCATRLPRNQQALPSRSFYNKRGTAEQWIKEGKQASRGCRAIALRLQLSVLAYNLGNLWRRLGLPSRIKSWSLTTLQHRLMKTGGRLVKPPAITGCCWRRGI